MGVCLLSTDNIRLLSGIYGNWLASMKIPLLFSGSPRKLNALDKRKLPRYETKLGILFFIQIKKYFRSKSVPRPPFTLFTPPSSSESNKRVPMNKIVLQANRPKINLKNIKPKINTMENANYKVGKYYLPSSHSLMT